MIGKSSIDVYPWQVDDPLWNARYRNPYLVLTASQRIATVSCEYDIANAAAVRVAHVMAAELPGRVLQLARLTLRWSAPAPSRALNRLQRTGNVPGRCLQGEPRS